MGNLAKAGKAEYPVPVFTNTWLVQPEDKTRANILRLPGAAGDRHLESRRSVDRHQRAGHPSAELHRLGSPASAARTIRCSCRCDGNPANAFDCIGEFWANCPFGINNTTRLAAFSPGAAAGIPAAPGQRRVRSRRPVRSPRSVAPTGCSRKWRRSFWTRNPRGRSAARG